jgi:transposase-like protein
MAGERYTQEFKIAAVQQITQEGSTLGIFYTITLGRSQATP